MAQNYVPKVNKGMRNHPCSSKLSVFCCKQLGRSQNSGCLGVGVVVGWGTQGSSVALEGLYPDLCIPTVPHFK